MMMKKKITTDHPDILIAKSRDVKIEKTINFICNMEKYILENNSHKAIQELMLLVPEFNIDPNSNLP